MDWAEASDWIALLDGGVAFGVLNRLVAAFGSASAVFDASDSQWRDAAGLRAATIDRLRDSHRDAARRRVQQRAMEEHGIRVVPAASPEYPRLLAESPDPPPALFVRGRIDPADAIAVAVVGPRLATPYGIEMARRIASGLAGVATVASGLANGIDSTAQQAALAAGGRVVGVAACGLDQDYPKGSAAAREAIAEGGALVSPWPPSTKPATHLFPQRNGVLAGLCLGVVVVEASEKSGALLTARAAAEAGREVFAVPGDATRRNSRGTNQLLREGAIVATSAGEVLEDLEGAIRPILQQLGRDAPRADRRAAAPPPGLGDVEALLLAGIAHAPTRYDDLVARHCPEPLGLGEVAAALLQLELKGLARQGPGKVYSATEAGSAAAGTEYQDRMDHSAGLPRGE